MMEYVKVPTLYPMGAITFSIACDMCVHHGEKTLESLRCRECMREKESGFELDKTARIVRKEGVDD